MKKATKNIIPAGSNFTVQRIISKMSPCVMSHDARLSPASKFKQFQFFLGL